MAIRVYYRAQYQDNCESPCCTSREYNNRTDILDQLTEYNDVDVPKGAEFGLVEIIEVIETLVWVRPNGN